MIQHNNKTRWGRVLIVLILVMALCTAFSTVFASEAAASDAPEDTMVALGMVFEDGDKGESDAVDEPVLTIGATPAETEKAKDDKVEDPETGDIIGIGTETAPKKDAWTCTECGKTNEGGEFCKTCWRTRSDILWTCEKCGSSNQGGVVCEACGEIRPAEWHCQNCSTVNGDVETCKTCETARPTIWTCKVCSTKNVDGDACTKCEASRPTTMLSVIALVVLVIVIAIGFIKKVNLGFLGIGAAFILAIIAGIGPKYVTKAFDADMFVTLVGVTFLFGMASQNGTLDLFSKKVVALVGKKTVLIPILMFFLSAFISAIGPGHIAAGILMTTFAVYLAFEMKINPITTALFAKLGANAGCASPLSLTGQLGLKLTNNLVSDVTNADIVDRLGFNGLHFFVATLVSGFIFTLLLYVFTKSYKVKADNPLKMKDIPKFNWKQWVTIGAIVMMVVLCIGFQMNTGLTAFVMAAILVLLGCADEKKAIKGIPWGTLVFICGVGVLVSVIDMMGGIDLISNLLQKLMNKHTATPVMAATSGILSWVSSTTGVVMPAMFKMLPNIMRNFGTNVNYMEMISAITATSFAAAISPLSTGGAIIMSSYSASKETTNAELNKIFKFLFLLSVGNVLLNVALSAIRLFGFYGIFG